MGTGTGTTGIGTRRGTSGSSFGTTLRSTRATLYGTSKAHRRRLLLPTVPVIPAKLTAPATAHVEVTLVGTTARTTAKRFNRFTSTTPTSVSRHHATLLGTLRTSCGRVTLLPLSLLDHLREEVVGYPGHLPKVFNELLLRQLTMDWFEPKRLRIGLLTTSYRTDTKEKGTKPVSHRAPRRPDTGKLRALKQNQI